MLTTDLDLAASLRLAIGRLARRLRQENHGGLTPSQRSVLASLFKIGPMRMSDLADREAISRPATTGIVARLVDKGLVARRDAPDDRRGSIVQATALGVETLDRARAERTALIAASLNGFTEEERQILASAAPLLERLVSPE